MIIMIRLIVANVLLELSKALARSDNGQQKLTFSDWGFSYTYERPGSDENLSWDTDLYQWGCVFIKGKANAVKVSTNELSSEGNHKLIPSGKYTMHMKNHVFEQALFADKLNFDKLFYAVLGVGAITALTFVAFVGYAFG